MTLTLDRDSIAGRKERDDLCKNERIYKISFREKGLEGPNLLLLVTELRHNLKQSTRKLLLVSNIEPGPVHLSDISLPLMI